MPKIRITGPVFFPEEIGLATSAGIDFIGCTVEADSELALRFRARDSDAPPDTFTVLFEDAMQTLNDNGRDEAGIRWRIISLLVIYVPHESADVILVHN